MPSRRLLCTHHRVCLIVESAHDANSSAPAGRSKESMAGRMEQYARAGYLTAAIDCRYHGDRAVPDAAWDGVAKQDPWSAYQDSLVRCAPCRSHARAGTRCVAPMAEDVALSFGCDEPRHACDVGRFMQHRYRWSGAGLGGAAENGPFCWTTSGTCRWDTSQWSWHAAGNQATPCTTKCYAFRSGMCSCATPLQVTCLTAKLFCCTGP